MNFALALFSGVPNVLVASLERKSNVGTTRRDSVRAFGGELLRRTGLAFVRLYSAVCRIGDVRGEALDKFGGCRQRIHADRVWTVGVGGRGRRDSPSGVPRLLRVDSVDTFLISGAGRLGRELFLARG